MNRDYLAGVVIFIMKYFFDVEREITQQLWTSFHIKALGIISGITQLVTLHKP